MFCGEEHPLEDFRGKSATNTLKDTGLALEWEVLGMSVQYVRLDGILVLWGMVLRFTKQHLCISHRRDPKQS